MYLALLVVKNRAVSSREGAHGRTEFGARFQSRKPTGKQPLFSIILLGVFEGVRFVQDSAMSPNSDLETSEHLKV